MNQFKTLLVFTLYTALYFISAGCESTADPIPPSEISIIPQPQLLVQKTGTFILNSSSTFSSSESFENATRYFSDLLKNGAGISLEEIAESEKADIVFKLDTTLPSESYKLTINQKKLVLSGGDKTGIFYGVQTLRQLLPADIEGGGEVTTVALALPCLEITDSPKFKYRGMHLDVGRHFFPKEFIKEYISYLAMLKMNYFHWHLTEDQGWRIEIEKYPRLTTHAAFRNETLIGHYNDQPQQFDGQRYGGYYTQDEIREIVDYAKEHHITIIPEIEMPGHAQAAVSAYPELGCAGDPVEVATKWGVFENIFCPNQKTFAFLEDVLTEVMDLFPGPYIHIGGDEAPKAQWKVCSHCQKLIEEHNLGDENGLQSWFIKRIETFVNSKGKKIIGWDEILEGGLAPNATVMSWRGTQGGIEAAKEGHDVIMTPTSHAYFDYYQSDKPDEPLAIGGYLPLEKVYSFNPVPEELSEDEAKHVLGAQGNVWTEYMKTPEKVQYMVFPRILAMSEVLWSGPSENPTDTYGIFVNRVERFNQRLEAMGVNNANHLYGIEGKVIKENNKISFGMSTHTEGKTIRFSVNDGSWEDYSEPIDILEDSKIEALVFKESQKLGDTFKQQLRFHKGILGSITLDKEPHPSYSAGGKEALINGISGSDSRYGDSEWLGFWGQPIEIDIELPEEVLINSINIRFYHAPGQWIYAPELIAARVTLENGETVANKSLPELVENGNLAMVRIGFTEGSNVVAKRIKILVNDYGTIPEGAQGAGNKAWTFIDEIIVE